MTRWIVAINSAVYQENVSPDTGKAAEGAQARGTTTDDDGIIVSVRHAG